MSEYKNNSKVEPIKFLRRELWLASYKENPEFDLDKLDEESSFGYFDASETEKMMHLNTPCTIRVGVDNDKEEITVYIGTKFELSSNKDSSNSQWAFETQINQKFKIINFFDNFFNEKLDKFIVPKEFANELVYGTICNGIGIIESLPKRKVIKKLNLHLGDKLKNTLKNDIVCSNN